MKIQVNQYRTDNHAPEGLEGIPFPSTDVDAAQRLFARCPKTGETPLADAGSLARACNIAALHIKDERARMDLGSFKALGAAYVIAHHAQSEPLSDVTYVTASAGNHGLSMAAGAKAFGARAVVYIAETVPQAFADRLASEGAEVVREGTIYEDSMKAAASAADENGWRLLSDSSWPGYTERPHRLLEGYLILMAEAIDQMPEPPTHIFLQAGVGGLAAAAAALARAAWGDAPTIIVVEPEVAPALTAAIATGTPHATEGPVSIMGRLDCKEPSLIAFRGLARDADLFALITEEEARDATRVTAEHGFASTPSGTAGIAALLASGDHRKTLGLTATSRVLTILSEAA